MQGKILDYNNEFKSGLIRGEDGNKYRFSIDDYKSDGSPKVGADVDFEPNVDKAVEVYVLNQKTVRVSVIQSKPTPVINPETQKNVARIVKKMAIWIVVIIIGIATIVTLVDYVERQKSEAEHQKWIAKMVAEDEARINGCKNNNSEDCYMLGMSNLARENYKAGQEALAKGCQLGNKDACYEGRYYKEGCELQDGRSCYAIAELIAGSEHDMECFMHPNLSWCKKSKMNEDNMKEYYQKACKYGYSQGCMKK